MTRPVVDPTEPIESTRVLNTVYSVDHRMRISYRRGSLLLRGPATHQRVPLSAVDAVVIFAGHITTDAISECASRKIRVSALTRGGKIKFTASGPVSGNVHLRAAHHAAASEELTAAAAARLIVIAKIRNSATVVRRWARDHPSPETTTLLRDRAAGMTERVKQAATAPNRDVLRGIEGDVARVYFKGLRETLSGAQLKFTVRSRRPPSDPINAALSFCYALLTTETTGACDAIGLDPQVGFLHQSLRAGRPSLALDLAEELRPVTDRFVVAAVKRGQLVPDDFQTTLGGACYLSEGGRRKLISLWEQHKNQALFHPLLSQAVPRWAIPTTQATLMARWLRDDLPTYPPYTMDD
ncbi:MAG: CRISPR-associated endonuclease Cas1 [Acidimicrobiaceae bacterium]|nr:CRISPR-associated endonuclease Cas1 [Acidimicrobiaceae bacterium]MDE0493966.1 CRISPR-associated endonuclease Cas1 [Acidimicrobiaceae bacterium]